MQYYFCSTMQCLLYFFWMDYSLNVLPANAVKKDRTSFLVTVLTQSFGHLYAILWSAMRAYLIVNAKAFSSFFQDIEDYGNASTRRGNRNGKKTGILVTVAVTVVFIQSVMLSLFLSKANGSQSRLFTLLGNRLYAILAFFFMSGPLFMVHVVGFAMATSGMDRTLEILEEFCDHIHSLVQQSPGETIMEETGPITHHDHLYIKLRPKESSHTRQLQELHARHLADQFYAIQTLFLTYNRLLGPLVLVMIFTGTMGTIDVMAGFLEPANATITTIYSYYKVLLVVKYVLFFTLLDYGYRSSNLVTISCGFCPNVIMIRCD